MSKSLVIVPLLLACIVDASPWDRNAIFSTNGRVVGGSDAPDGQYPHQVSLQLFQSHYCGASIISSEWILTAAHCVEKFPAIFYSIFVGANNLNGEGTRYRVLEIHYHEKYDNINIKNDVSVLKVEPVTYTDKVQPIALEKEEIGGDQSCVLSGWGMLSFPTGPYPDKLQHITLLTTTTDFCKSQHVGTVGEDEICTLTKEGEGACHADSGGPLVRKINGINKQIGIVSWGISCARGLPDVFTRVSSFIPWINEKCNNCVA